MILGRWVSFSCGNTPVTKVSDQRHAKFRGLSSTTTCRPSLRCSCLKSKSTQETTQIEQLGNEQGFSVLASEVPWEDNNIWSTFVLYMFSLHIPLSFGGLSIVANILHRQVLDPQTQVLSLVVLQMVELSGTVLLLRTTAKPQCKSINFLKGNNESREGRNWVVGSALGLGCLVGFIFITSLVADQLFGSKAVENSELEKIMVSGEVARSGCFALYCGVAPILEEIVYRRFLLTSLASRMEWWKALVISSGVFAAAHFSGQDFVQLFGLGCVIGSCYIWSGNLASSVLVHSLYNALTLLS
ncbi:CAAX prenyl protease 2 [Arabidopsis thaliana x Arabidopsis arenosa]|uniref:CAAX prenyl protease 2 n=2 Tax=Arabidopsis thaliana x Arabidopsis arenosa TaxID=1240361 RepID=A0A8T2B2R4_9BRAS|nr:CAAX prenyl protease 2 [Arabidopsis thaliana x Arabidopsis arenosa]